jgi:hypothetical protein
VVGERYKATKEFKGEFYMTKFNRLFVMLIGIMVLGLSACSSIERKTASSSQEDDSHYKPQLLDRKSDR